MYYDNKSEFPIRPQSYKFSFKQQTFSMFFCDNFSHFVKVFKIPTKN